MSRLMPTWVLVLVFLLGGHWSVAQPTFSPPISFQVTPFRSTVALIHLDDPMDPGSPARVYFNDDVRVFSIGSGNPELLQLAKNAADFGYLVEVYFQVQLLGDTVDFVLRGLSLVSTESVLTTGILPRPAVPPVRIVAQSKRELDQLFNHQLFYHYSSNDYDVSDNCFNRAQFWSRTLQFIDQSETIGGSVSGKVFIFFSEAYQKKHKHKWWYHVAPVVYLNTPRGEEPWVFDPTFVSRPIRLQASQSNQESWLTTFADREGGRCLQIRSLRDYERLNSIVSQVTRKSDSRLIRDLIRRASLEQLFESENEIDQWIQNPTLCMYIVNSGFNYVPSDLSTPAGLPNWRCSDFGKLTRFAAPGSKPLDKRVKNRTSWSDPQFTYVLPEGCSSSAFR